MASSVPHGFGVRVNPANQFRVYGRLVGNAKTSNGPHNFYDTSYFAQGPFGIGNSFSDGESSAGACTRSSAVSSFGYASIAGPIPVFAGFIDATTQASAVPGCATVWASAEAYAALSVREGQANRFGRINWRPRFNMAIGSSSWGFARDPVTIDFLDANTENSLLPENLRTLLSISATNESSPNGSGSTCVATGSNRILNPTVEWGDTALSGSLCDGSFEIVADNPYLLNPGTLRLVAEDGLIVDRVVDGAFSQLASRLPNLGDSASFNLLFDTDFTGEIDLDYDFTSIVTSPDVDAVFGFDGGGDAYAHVPAPLPWLGIGAVFSLSRKLRKRIKA